MEKIQDTLIHLHIDDYNHSGPSQFFLSRPLPNLETLIPDDERYQIEEAFVETLKLCSKLKEIFFSTNTLSANEDAWKALKKAMTEGDITATLSIFLIYIPCIGQDRRPSTLHSLEQDLKMLESPVYIDVACLIQHLGSACLALIISTYFKWY